jgi:nucleoside-diphosphate kinase
MTTGTPQPTTAGAADGEVNWADWTVILLKPDCVARDLVAPVLAWVATETTLVNVRWVRPTEEQIFAHYDDMLPLSATIRRDVPAELRRIFVGNTVVIALGHSRNATARVRTLVGPTDPVAAPATTIRGRYARDSLAKAMTDGRLVDNIIHTSDNPAAAHRDLNIWYGPNDPALLRTPAHTTTSTGGTP